MLVINTAGFVYKLKLKNGEITVPNDGQPHEVPDEIANFKFDNVFKVIVPPKSEVDTKCFETVQEVQETKKDSDIIEIDIQNGEKPITESVKGSTTIEVPKEEKDKPPLKGIKIKKSIREKLIKKGKNKLNGEIGEVDGNN